MPARLLARLGLLAALLASPLARAAGELEQAQGLWMQGHRTQAVQLLRSAMATTPEDPRLRFALATMQMEQGQLDEAERALRSLTEDHPDLADPFNNLAVIRAGRGDFVGAREALEQALRLQPEHVAALENLGDVLLRQAQQRYELAFKLAAGDKQALNVKLDRLRAVLTVVR